MLEQESYPPYADNVTELRIPTKTAFAGLNEGQRVAFVKANRGFLQDVVDALAAAKTAFSFSTVSRTWYGKFKTPNPHIVAALNSEYQRLFLAAEANGIAAA
jgi:hypothetical protein